MDDFNFYIPLQKDFSINNDTLTGVASTISLDRDGERMSEKALADMQRDIMSVGVNLFGNHEHSWENTLGSIKDATVSNNQLGIKVQLDDPTTNQKIPMLLNKLKRGIKLGLSIGGKTTSEKWEYNKELGKKIKVIDGVRLYEVSVVGIPSNSDSFISIPTAIVKSRQLLKAVVYSCDICGHKERSKEELMDHVDGHHTKEEIDEYYNKAHEEVAQKGHSSEDYPKEVWNRAQSMGIEEGNEYLAEYDRTHKTAKSFPNSCPNCGSQKIERLESDSPLHGDQYVCNDCGYQKSQKTSHLCDACGQQEGKYRDRKTNSWLCSQCYENASYEEETGGIRPGTTGNYKNKISTQSLNNNKCLACFSKLLILQNTCKLCLWSK